MVYYTATGMLNKWLLPLRVDGENGEVQYKGCGPGLHWRPGMTSPAVLGHAV
jgi:hypothetical protein